MSWVSWIQYSVSSIHHPSHVTTTTTQPPTKQVPTHRLVSVSIREHGLLLPISLSLSLRMWVEIRFPLIPTSAAVSFQEWWLLGGSSSHMYVCPVRLCGLGEVGD